MCIDDIQYDDITEINNIEIEINERWKCTWDDIEKNNDTLQGHCKIFTKQAFLYTVSCVDLRVGNKETFVWKGMSVIIIIEQL